MSSDLERLNIILAVRDREFAKAMTRNQRRMEKFATKTQAGLSKTSKKFDLMGMAARKMAPLLAALGAAAVLGKIKSTISTLDDIGKTADKIGLTTTALQELRTVAESAGVSQGSLDSSMERFNKRLGEASMGGGAANKMLKAMGLEAANLMTIPLDEALGVVADKIAGIVSPAERAAAAAALFGREGVAMVTLMREGSAGMEKMRQEARDLGIILDESLIRGAEDAQTKLDLMSRVISAQLNAALIDLAPLLVAGAVAIADVARAVNASIDAIQGFLGPQTAMELATENLVTAMGDEIRQSQLLEAALGRGMSMSVGAAQTKIGEAKARYQNVAAIIAEHRAMVLGSTEYQDLSDTIRRTSADIEEMRTVQDRAAEQGINLPGISSDDATLAAETAAAYGRLNTAINERFKIKLTNDEMDAQLVRSAENIAKLQTAMDNAKGGVVTIKGDYISPLDNSEKKDPKKTKTAAAAKASIPALTDYEKAISAIKEAFGGSVVAGQGYREELAQLEARYSSGAMTADQYKLAIEALAERFDKAEEAAKGLKDQAASTFASIVTESATASDAISGLFSNLANQFANAAFGNLLSGGAASGVFGALGDLLSFDGGGDTPSGPRSGGVDGKGGFAAILHPNESVIDHTRGQSAAPGRSGGGATEINVNVSGARGNSEISTMVENGVRRGLAEYDRKVLPVRVGQVRRDPRRIG